MTRPDEPVAILLTEAEGQSIILANLQRDLARAFDTEPDQTSPEDERARYMIALVAVGRLLDGVGAPPAHSLRFKELASALSDLDTGTVRPLLAPAKVESRPGYSSDIWRLRALVCLGVAAYTEAGLSRIDAARRVATKHKSFVKRATRGTGNVLNDVVNWDNQFKAGRVSNREASELYESSVGKVQRHIQTIPEAKRLAWVDGALARSAEGW